VSVTSPIYKEMLTSDSEGGKCRCLMSIHTKVFLHLDTGCTQIVNFVCAA